MCFAAERESTTESLRNSSAICHLTAESATFIVCWSLIEAIRYSNGIRTKQNYSWRETIAVFSQSFSAIMTCRYPLFVSSTEKTAVSPSDLIHGFRPRIRYMYYLVAAFSVRYSKSKSEGAVFRGCEYDWRCPPGLSRFINYLEVHVFYLFFFEITSFGPVWYGAEWLCFSSGGESPIQ